jgi:putative transposase
MATFFPAQFWGQHLWAGGYFVASSGNVADKVIAQYIAMQTEKSQNDNEDFQVGEL